MGEDRAFDAVVVGSGFGGSVMAYRLEQCGQKVRLLERGRPWAPGSFPRTPYEFATAIWDPAHGSHGLLDVWSFRGLGALVSSGLGGGSLIYANVLLRKEDAWFKERPGPREPVAVLVPRPRAGLRRGREGDRADAVPAAPAGDHAEGDRLLRRREAAGIQDTEWPPLAITFSERGEELGRPFDKPSDERARRAALHVPARRRV